MVSVYSGSQSGSQQMSDPVSLLRSVGTRDKSVWEVVVGVGASGGTFGTDISTFVSGSTSEGAVWVTRVCGSQVCPQDHLSSEHGRWPCMVQGTLRVFLSLGREGGRDAGLRGL